MVRFGLIRHARTRWNLKKKIQGKIDIPLSPEGIRDAKLWGDILKPEKYDIILSSPLLRAQQTSQILAKRLHVDVQYYKELREQDFGTWEGKRLTDIRRQAPGEVKLQESKGWEFCPPCGEPRALVLERVMDVLWKAAQVLDGKNILLVSHSSVMKTIIYKVLERSFTPDEPRIIKAYHLHVLTWDKTLKVEALNSIKLSAKQERKDL